MSAGRIIVMSTLRGLAQGPDPSALTTTEAILVFAGVPLGITLLITVLVYAAAGRIKAPRDWFGRRGTNGPQSHAALDGFVAEPTRCWVGTDGGNREVHHASPPEAAGSPRELDSVCWSLRCAVCGLPYRDGPDLMHFTGPSHAVTVARTEGWVLIGRRMHCRSCVADVTRAGK